MELVGISNATIRSSASSLDLFEAIIKNIIYCIFGAILSLANPLTIVVVLRHSGLRARKEYILLTGLAFADMLAGFATIIAGAYRLNLIEHDEQYDQERRWRCMGAPHFLLMIFSSNIQAVMLLMVSVDRVIAVAKPFAYRKFTRRYAVLVIFSSYSLAALYTTLVVVYVRETDTSENRTEMSVICLLNEVDRVFDSIFYERLILASLSIVSYLAAWYLFRRNQLLFTDLAFSMGKSPLHNAQRHLSITIGICVLFTFPLYVVPNGIKILSGYGYIDPDLWGPIGWILCCCNAVVNVFVFSLRHEDIRRGVKLLFICKELPSPSVLPVFQKESVIQA